MFVSRLLCLPLAICLGIPGASPVAAQQDHPRGRKYKAPPATSHLEILVLKSANGKPIVNAAVVFHPTKEGHDEGSLEIKTDPDGKAIIEIIPTGSTVTMQVIAEGFATHAEEFVLSDASRSVVVRMLRPQAQISAYQENHGRDSDRPAGVQEPVRPTTPPVIQPAQPSNHISDPNPLSPVSPNAPAPQNPTPKALD